jgi:hypothetical protein
VGIALFSQICYRLSRSTSYRVLNLTVGCFLPGSPTVSEPGNLNMKTKRCIRCNLSKPLTKFSKASRSKDGLYHLCRDCKSIEAADYYAANSDKVKARVRAYDKKNREKVLAKKRKYYADHVDEISKKHKDKVAANPGYRKEYYDAWYAANRDKQLPKLREYTRNNREAANKRNREWNKRNRSYWNNLLAKRRAALLQATPSWADLDKIEAFYIEAARLTKETGVPHHVDHIVPLQSKWVCGLHCEFNLQILPGIENIRKSNKFWPDMPEFLRQLLTHDPLQK